MGRSHLRCKNRTLLLCSVSLLRVGDKFAFLLNSRLILFYFIYFILLLVLYYCPKLGQLFFTKWCYSPDYVFILSDLVPHWILIVSFVWTVVMVHGFLQMDSACGVYRPNGLVFYHRLWNRSQHVSCFHVCYCDLSGVAYILQFVSSQLWTECRRACLVQI